MNDLDKEQLIHKVQTTFIARFNNLSTITTLTPGRINIIGEHTDYNVGLAMPVTINRWICTIISNCNKGKNLK